MRRLRWRRPALVTAVTLGLLGGVTAPAVAGPAREQTCPDVVVVAARGSDQNWELDPTSYSEESPWVSNGYEEQNIRAFLRFAEERHREKTGESLLRDVHVLGVDDSVYPAELPLPALAEDGEELDALGMLRRLAEIRREGPLHRLAVDSASSFVDSLTSGIGNTLGFIDDWEAESGCRPGYILVGFSQGALVLTAQERALADRGQLLGVLYMGNPLLRPGEVSVVGDPARATGILSGASGSSGTVAESRRINYCVDGDAICDLTSSAAQRALAGGGGVHFDYFLDERIDGSPREVTDHDRAVADTFASWITGYTAQP